MQNTSQNLNKFVNTFHSIRYKIKNEINKLIPRPIFRWSIFLVILFSFIIRIMVIGRFYFVAYGLGIFLLYGFVSFCSPNDDSIPCPLDDFDDFDVSNIPMNSIQEMEDYKPFDRKLPDYQYWESSMFCVLLAFILTFIDVFDIPVYAPILVLYFLIMCFSIGRNIYLHMKKFNYNPFDFFSKKKY